MLSVIILSVTFLNCYFECHCPKYHYAECIIFYWYAECHNAECHYGEYIVSLIYMLNVIMLSVKILIILSVLMLSVACYWYSECRYSGCHYTECRIVECRYAEGRVSPRTLKHNIFLNFIRNNNNSKKIFVNLIRAGWQFPILGRTKLN
jgi:hypothetical protein